MKRIIVGSLLLSCALSVEAGVAVPYGWYVEANVGRSHSLDKAYPGSTKETGLGESAAVGYKFSTWVAGEVGFANYAYTRVSNPAGTDVAKDRHYSYNVAAKLLLPVGVTGFELFGKLGAGRIHSNVTVTNPAAAAASGYAFNSGTHSANGLYIGAGADYALMPNLLLNVQWDRQKGSNNTGDLDLYGLGLSYIF